MLGQLRSGGRRAPAKSQAVSTNESDYADRARGRSVTSRDRRTQTDGMPTVLVESAHGQTETNRRWAMYDRPRFTHRVAVILDLDDLSPLSLPLGAEIHASNARQPEFAAGVDLIVQGKAVRMPEGIVTFTGWG